MWSSKLFISMLTRTACSMQMHRACTPIRVYIPSSYFCIYIYIYIMLHLHSLHNILSPPMNHSHSTYILPSPAKNASTQPQCQHPNPATHKPTHVLKPINQTKKQCKQEALAGIVISNMWACSEFVQLILRFFCFENHVSV